MKDWRIHRASPSGYDPSTDAGVDIWLDGSDPSTLFDTGGAAITNGATVGRWESKAIARSFRQFGGNARPTWDATGFNGHAGVRFNSQILTATTSAGYAALAGSTVMFAAFLVAPVAGGGCGFGITEPHETAGANSSLVFVALATAGGGGRRHQGDPFGGVGSKAVPNNTAMVNTLALDFTGKRGTAYLYGVEDILDTPFAVAGSGATAATPDPFGISVGGFAQESAGSIGNPCNGTFGEILVWKSYQTPDQLVPAHDYLCMKWGGGLM